MKKFFRRLSILTLVSFMAFASACAFGTRKVNLMYAPANVASGQGQGQEVVVNKFRDQRGDQRIGVVKNAYGMETAKVIANNDVAEWISNAVVTELQQAGVKVTRGMGQRDPVKIVLNGTITRVFCDISMKLRADIIVTLQLIKGNQTLLNQTYTGQASITAWTASAKEYGKVFNLALQYLMRKKI